MSKKIADKGSSEAFLRAHIGFEADDCLLWPFRTAANGYGLAVVGGIQKRASRWMCILAHGDPQNSSMQAAHECGNRRCVNPKHLSWKTPAQNSADKYRHGTHIFGEKSGKTLLTADDIIAIRQSPNDLVALAARFNVSKGCIAKIRNKTRWPHIEQGKAA